MKKTLDEIYRLKFSIENEISELQIRFEKHQSQDDFEGGKEYGKMIGRIEAKQFDLVRINQIIHNLLKDIK